MSRQIAMAALALVAALILGGTCAPSTLRRVLAILGPTRTVRWILRRPSRPAPRRLFGRDPEPGPQ
jgi:hypothetical protein